MNEVAHHRNDSERLVAHLLLLLCRDNAIARRRGLVAFLATFASFVRLMRLLVASVVVIVRQVLMRHLFDQEEGDDADDYHKICFVFFVVMTMAMMVVALTMMALTMMAVSTICLSQFWQRVEKDISEQATDSKRYAILNHSLFTLISADTAEGHVYRVNKEYRHDRNKDGRHDGLRPRRQWSENLFKNLYEHVCL